MATFLRAYLEPCYVGAKCLFGFFFKALYLNTGICRLPASNTF